MSPVLAALKDRAERTVDSNPDKATKASAQHVLDGIDSGLTITVGKHELGAAISEAGFDARTAAVVKDSQFGTWTVQPNGVYEPLAN